MRVEECIEQVKDRYKVTVQVRLEDGRRVKRRQTLPEGATLQEARTIRESMRLQLRGELGIPSEPLASRPLLAEYIRDWLEAKRARLKPSSYAEKKRILTQYVIPILGHLDCDDVRRRDVQAWVTWAEAQRKTVRGQRHPYARATLTGWWRVLKPVLQDMAADVGIMDPTVRVKGPVSQARPDDRARRELRTLTGSELGRLLEVVRQARPRRYPEVLTLAWTGVRVGELHALHWEDWDGAESLIIRRGLSKGELSTTKTGAERVVYVPQALQEALSGWRRTMLAEQHPGLASGVMFPSDVGGLRGNNSLKKTFELCIRRAGITQRVTPQVLRRTFNSLMRAADVDRIVLRSLTGHSDEKMTELYSHIHIDEKRAAVELALGEVR